MTPTNNLETNPVFALEMASKAVCKGRKLYEKFHSHLGGDEPDDFDNLSSVLKEAWTRTAVGGKPNKASTTPIDFSEIVSTLPKKRGRKPKIVVEDAVVEEEQPTSYKQPDWKEVEKANKRTLKSIEADLKRAEKKK
jgi:hypothetical protein